MNHRICIKDERGLGEISRNFDAMRIFPLETRIYGKAELLELVSLADKEKLEAVNFESARAISDDLASTPNGQQHSYIFNIFS